MKSAYELAMERLGGESKQLSDEQKARLAELSRIYEAKTAEAKLSAQDRMKKAEGNNELLEQIRQDLAVELASIREKEEREKDKVRNEG